MLKKESMGKTRKNHSGSKKIVAVLKKGKMLNIDNPILRKKDLGCDLLDENEASSPSK